jgi:cobalt-zinc-cadmium efflux system outer membrane protein
MTTRRRAVGWLGIAFTLAIVPRAVLGQAPTITGPDAIHVRESTSLGPVPGSGGTRGGAPADVGTIIGGRAGPSVPRVRSNISRPGGGFRIEPTEGVTLPPTPPLTELPLYGTLSVPEDAADEGPPHGLTLDAAIERLLRENLDLRAQFHEIAKADADILTAGLRANPVLYADGQLVPYGNFSPERPGGGTQYDLNISYPLDLSRKRQARSAVACQARRVIEAQFQDAARQQIDNLGTAYVNVLAARETVRYARTSLAGVSELLDRAERLLREGEGSPDDVDRFALQRESATVGLQDAEESLRKARRELAPLLSLTPSEAERIELRGTIAAQAPPPPPVEALVGMALAGRPDLAAIRLGVGLARADVRLAHAEKYQDVYVLYQPYTFQNNEPFDRKSAHSWALGVTVPLPVYNRNQGNILRARTNVSQTLTQLAAAEQRVVNEVRQAEREYAVTRAAVERVEGGLLPRARRVRDDALREYTQGESGLMDYLIAQRDYNEIVRQYRDTQVRHRRSMLALNTAVGRRILP